jgi:hypothetical protein
VTLLPGGEYTTGDKLKMLQLHQQQEEAAVVVVAVAGVAAAARGHPFDESSRQYLEEFETLAVTEAAAAAAAGEAERVAESLAATAAAVTAEFERDVGPDPYG